MEYVLTTDGLTKRYGHFTALSGLSMHVPKGSIYTGLWARTARARPR